MAPRLLQNIARDLALAVQKLIMFEHLFGWNMFVLWDWRSWSNLIQIQLFECEFHLWNIALSKGPQSKDKILTVFDRIAPLSKHGEPVRALFCTYVFGAALVLIGEVNATAWHPFWRCASWWPTPSWTSPASFWPMWDHQDSGQQARSESRHGRLRFTCGYACNQYE